MSSDQPQRPGPSVGKGVAASAAAGLRRFNRIGCVLLPLIIVAGVWVSYRLSAREAERALDAEIERLTAAGIIVPIEDLIPKVPPGERNAADVYEQAFAAFVPPSPEEEQLLLGGVSDDLARSALAVRVVQQNETYFDLIDEATRLTYCAFPNNRSDVGALAHRGTMLTSAARWQLVRAEALLSRGRPDEALSCAVAILRIGEHLKLEPVIVGQLCAYITHGVAVDGAISVAVSRGDPSPEACREVFRFLAGVDNTPAFARALGGEVAVFDMPLINEVRHDSYSSQEAREVLGSNAWPRAVVLSAAGRLLGPEDMLNLLKYRERIICASTLPWPDIRSAYRDAGADLASVPVLQSALADASTNPEHDFSMVVTRDWNTAKLRAAQVALAAAAAYRAEHGEYPDSLDDLTAAGWDLPCDPFGGGPLHYRREGSGFVVWSVGPNLADDGAVEYAGKPMSVEDGAYDIVFRCERSQQAGTVDSSP